MGGSPAMTLPSSGCVWRVSRVVCSVNAHARAVEPLPNKSGDTVRVLGKHLQLVVYGSATEVQRIARQLLCGAHTLCTMHCCTALV